MNTLYDLLLSFKDTKNILEILEKEKDFFKKGKLYEAICEILILLGFCDVYPNNLYDHYCGNISTNKFSIVRDIEKYLKEKNIFGSHKNTVGRGKSDITLFGNNKWIFISVKSCPKNLEDFDIDKIMAVANTDYFKNANYVISLIAFDKNKTLKIIKNAQQGSNHLKKKIINVFGLSDFENYFKLLKKEFLNFDLKYLNKRFSKKPCLTFRFHQELTIYKTINTISDKFLYAHKPRSGKTYIIGGVFLEYLKKNKKINGLIISPTPLECKSQFTTDLFLKYSNFFGINIVEINNGFDLENIKLKNNNIIVVSKQQLDYFYGENVVSPIKNLNLDFIVFDEDHFFGTTEMASGIINSYSSEKTIKIFLSGTPSKVIAKWDIKENCCFFWDIEDENYCKKRNIEKLVERHGKEALLFLKNTKKLKVYDNCPELVLFSTHFNEKFFSDIKEKIKDTSYGFSYKTLFSTTKTDFNFENEISKILAYISGSNKLKDFPNGDKSIFNRLKNKSLEKTSRNPLFFSQLWFLQCGNDIELVSVCLKRLMKKDNILKNYKILIVNSKRDTPDLKKLIDFEEKKAKNSKKSGLIILAGRKCSLGITLPNVDVVFLLNDTLSSDTIQQMMYRCMTEAKNKKYGYVVDFNFSRVLNTTIDIFKNKNMSDTSIIKYVLENNLIDIDRDMFENKQEQIERFQKYWTNNFLNNFKSKLKNIENINIEISEHVQKLLNKLVFLNKADTLIGNKTSFYSDQKLPSGRKIIKEDKEDNVSSSDEEEETIINASMMYKYYVPLVCILTVKEDEEDFNKMLADIKENKELLEIFEGCTFSWFKQKEFIKQLIYFSKKIVKKDTEIYKVIKNIKFDLKNFIIDHPKELLEIIDEYLKPKKIERATLGEVFTPLSEINNLIENLEKYDKDFFKDPTKTYYDPANGMGNFPIAIYIKLMETLKEVFPNEKERKQHILEKMLFMSEINKKNIYICKLLFDPNNEYKLNLHYGDTLTFDPSKEWNINKFSVVMGNPPYNKGGIRSHTGKQLGEKNETIWPKFIDHALKYLKKDGYLLFITPLSWLKKSHSHHNILLEKQIIWLNIWDNSKSKEIITADIPISLYILKNCKMFEKTKIKSQMKRRHLDVENIEFLNKNYSIPLAYHSIFSKLIKFIEKNNLHLDIETKTAKATGQKIKLPEKYSEKDMYAVDTYTVKDGILVKKLLEKNTITCKKLIIANKASFAGAFIDDGKLGLCGNHKYYIQGDNLEIIKDLLNFKICDVICHSMKYGQDFLEKDAFNYIPDLRKLNIKTITEEKFYRMIKLDDDEIKSIT